jgi:hypothetical protein
LWSLSAALFVALSFCNVSPLMSQSITIRVLNARSGRPLAHQHVTIAWADKFAPTVVSLGPDGTGKLDVAGRSQFVMLSGPKSSREPYRIAYINCNNFSTVQVDDVLSRGLVSANLCSAKVSAKVKPGEVVFWGVPLHWWAPDLQ